MGASNAQGMAEAVNDGLVSFETALEWHLFSNHYPPLPREVFDLAKEAIENANAGEYDKTIDVSGVGEHRRYGTLVPTHACISAWHLEPFIVWEVE